MACVTVRIKCVKCLGVQEKAKETQESVDWERRIRSKMIKVWCAKCRGAMLHEVVDVTNQSNKEGTAVK